MRRFAWGMVALACVTPGLVWAALSASQGQVTFTCVGPGGLRFEGTGHELLAAEVGDALVVTVALSKITTGIGIRDSHMQEKYLESDKYPTAELSVVRASLSFPGDGAHVEATAPATMTIHGVSRTASVHYKAARKGNVYDVQGDVRINMNDYGIPIPSYLGVTVKPPVEIHVVFQLTET